MKDFTTYVGLESLEQQMTWAILTLGNVLMPEDYSDNQRSILATIQDQPKENFGLGAAWLKDAWATFPQCAMGVKILKMAVLRRDLIRLLHRPSDEIVREELVRIRKLAGDIPDSRWDYVPSFEDDLYSLHAQFFKDLYGMFDWDQLSNSIVQFLNEKYDAVDNLVAPPKYRIAVMPRRIASDVKFAKENMTIEEGRYAIFYKIKLIKRVLRSVYTKHNSSAISADIDKVSSPLDFGY